MRETLVGPIGKEGCQERQVLLLGRESVQTRGEMRLPKRQDFQDLGASYPFALGTGVGGRGRQLSVRQVEGGRRLSGAEGWKVKGSQSWKGCKV